jgi:RNA polymerase sigma-70 factor (ECF subfamily)
VEKVREEALPFDGGEDRMDLDTYLEFLGEDHQEIIRLRYYLDMDYKAIAQLLEIPMGTVKSRLNAAINKLRVLIGEENWDEQA